MKVIISLNLFLCFYLPVFGQKLPVQTFSTKDGLISNFVTEIYQDSKGYLWIGTDEGISLFDGYTFKNIRFDQAKVWGFVNDIIESKTVQGEMWIATNGGGLIKYYNGEITSFQLSVHPSSNYINSLLEIEDGSLWCATDNGLYKFFNGNAERLDYNFIKYPKLVRSYDGAIWCYDERGLWSFISEQKKIIHPKVKGLPVDSIVSVSALPDSSISIVKSDKKSTVVYIVKNSEIIKKYPLIFSVAGFTIMDTEKKYWIGTTDGLFVISDSRTQTEYHLYTTANGLPNNVLSIGFVDKEQNMWFGSFGKGLTKIEPIQSIQFSFPGMSGKGISDSFSHLWIPSSHGLHEVWQDSSFQWRKDYHLLGDYTNYLSPVAVVVDSQKNLWISHTDGSLHYFEVIRKPLRASVLKQKYSLSEKIGFPRSLSISLFIDSRNILWYGLHSGGIVGVNFSSSPKLVAQFIFQKNTTLRDVRSLYEDQSGNIWILGFDSENRIIKKEKNIFILDSISSILTQLPPIPFRSMVQTNDGTLWFGSRYNGLFYYRNAELRQLTTSNGLISNQIWSLATTPNNGLLIGTQAGLMEMPDYRVNHFSSLQQFTESPVLTTFSESNISLAISPFELTIFSIDSLSVASQFPTVLFTSIYINGKEEKIQNEMNLSSEKNTITIDYTTIAFRNTTAMRFQYKLEPLEDRWREATINRSVTYASLKPGEYSFSVRSISPQGTYSTPESTIHFIIATPFWKQWWFIALSLLCIGSSIIVIEKYRVRRLLEIEKIRSRIAADLHDDIGSGLTRIALLSEIIKQQSLSLHTEDESKYSIFPLTNKVGTISRELVDAMSDVVWSIDPKNFSMEKLIHRIKTFATEMCDGKEIALHFNAEKEIEKLNIDSDVARTILLITKEAVNNVVRHSEATTLRILLHNNHTHIFLEIIDNGEGFVMEELERQNGLINMHNRSQKTGGQCSIVSSKGNGTIISVNIPLHHH